RNAAALIFILAILSGLALSLSSAPVWLTKPARTRSQTLAVVADYGLGHAELFQRQKALLAAMATLAYTAEWQLDTATRAIAIDEHLSGFQTLGQALLTGAVLAPDRRHQAVLGAIGQGDGIVFVIKRHGGQHGAEYLFQCQFMIARHRAEQRRRHVVAL